MSEDEAKREARELIEAVRKLKSMPEEERRALFETVDDDELEAFQAELNVALANVRYSLYWKHGELPEQPPDGPS